MSTSQTVAQHLPYLRRYARALSGSQASGDAYVAATLEALVQDPKMLDTSASTRIALYKLFTKIWNSVAVNGEPGGSDTKQPVERHLAQIAPMPRQAFLLVALEGLSEDDAAKVLDIDVPKLRALVEDSGRELAAEIGHRRADHRGRTDHRARPGKPGHRARPQGVGIAAHARRGGGQGASSKRPGLVLADINLGDGGSGIDAVNEILAPFDIPVIFITAYPGAPAHRRAAGADLPDRQAVPAGER